MQNDPVNIARDVAAHAGVEQAEKITLMGIIKSEESRGVVGVATFILTVLTAVLFWTLLSDIRSDVKAIKTETAGNTVQVNRIQEKMMWMEKRLDHLEKEIEK